MNKFFQKNIFLASLVVFSCTTSNVKTGRVPNAEAGNKVFFVTDPDSALRIRWDLLDQETEEIFADFHIFDANGVGEYSLAKLCLKSRQGVKVRLMVDGLGNSIWKIAYIDGALLRIFAENCKPQDPEKSDVPAMEVRFWNPTQLRTLKELTSESKLRRNHDKILYTSKLNTVYEGDRNWQNINYRRDDARAGKSYFSVDAVTTGPVTNDVKGYLEQVWALAQAMTPVLKKNKVIGKLQQYEYYQETYDSKKKDFLAKMDEVQKGTTDLGSEGVEKILWNAQGQDVQSVQFLHFNAAKKLAGDDQTMNDELVNFISSAQEELLFTTPFLMMPPKLIDAIEDRAKKGIKVTLITSQPTSMLVPQFYQFQNRDISRLQKAGVKIDMNTGSDALHVKSIIVDHKRTFVGTHNLNMRSFDLDLETGFLFDDVNVANDLTNFLMANSQDYKKRTVLTHYILSPIIKPLLHIPFIHEQF